MTKRWNELDEYFALHRIWLPKALESAMAELTDMYREHARKWESALEEWARPQPMGSDLESAEALNESLNQGHKLYEGQVRETRDWFEGERHRLEGVMWSAARKVLAVDEQEDEGGGGQRK